VFLSNLHIFLPPFLPSFIKVDNTGYAPNAVWLGLLLVFILTYTLARSKNELPRLFRPAVTIFLLAGSVLLWVLYPRPAPYPTRSVAEGSPQARGYFLFPMGGGVVIKPGGQLYLHFSKGYDILFVAKRKADRLKLSFGSDTGEYELSLRVFDLPLFEGLTTRQRRSLEYRPLFYYPYKNFYLYMIRVDLRQLSRENMLIEPFFFEAVPWAR